MLLPPRRLTNSRQFTLYVVAYDVDERDRSLKDMKKGREHLDSDDWPDMIKWYGKPGFTSVHCFYDAGTGESKALLGPRRLSSPIATPLSSRTPSPGGKGKGRTLSRSPSRHLSPPWDPLQGPLGWAVNEDNLRDIAWGDARSHTSIRLSHKPGDRPQSYELLFKLSNGRLVNMRDLLTLQRTQLKDLDMTKHARSLKHHFGMGGYTTCSLHARTLDKALAVVLGPDDWSIDAPSVPPKLTISGASVYEKITGKSAYDPVVPARTPRERIEQWTGGSGMFSRPRTPSPSAFSASSHAVINRNAQQITPSVAGSQYDNEWGHLTRRTSAGYGSGSRAPSIAGSATASTAANSQYTAYTQGGTPIPFTRSYPEASTYRGNTVPLPMRAPQAAAQGPPRPAAKLSASSISSSSSSSGGTVKASGSRPPPSAAQPTSQQITLAGHERAARVGSVRRGRIRRTSKTEKPTNPTTFGDILWGRKNK